MVNQYDLLAQRGKTIMKPSGGIVMKTVLTTKEAPEAIGPYSQGIVNRGDTIFVSGQIPVDPSNGMINGTDIETQARQSLKNVGAVLMAAGATYDDVVKTTCFIKDMKDFATFNRVYSEFFKCNCPARSCVAVKELPKGALCEIEVIAIKEHSK